MDLRLIRSGCRSLLRTLALRGTDNIRFELPGFGYVDQFVRTYCITPPDQRADYLKFVGSSEPYYRALVRYGGIDQCFKIVLGDTYLPNFMAQHFLSEECARPRVQDAVNSIIQIGQFVGLPEELIR